MRARSQAWIPPEPLLFAQAALLFSWVLLFIAGNHGDFGPSAVGFAWIHTIVLGWLTMIALSFLIYLIPEFTDVRWTFEQLARDSLWIYQVGVVTLIAGFVLWIPHVIATGGAIVVVALVLYLIPFFATVATAVRRGDRRARAIARALGVVVGLLGITVGLGFALSIGLSLGRAFVVGLARIHAMLGVIGWQSLLVAGVSTRTYNRLVRRADRRASHIVTSSFVLLGLLLWIAGDLAGVNTVALCGGVLIGVGAVVYLFSTVASLRLAEADHRLPREFVAASALWLTVTIGYGIAALLGHGVPAAFLFALLIGWIGQNVNAHLMHVGIRLLATLVIADDDETEPAELLDRRVGVASLVLSQLAVACGIAGLTMSMGILLEVAACFGICGMAAMAVNVLRAVQEGVKRLA